MSNSMVSCVTFFSIFRAKIEVWLTSNYVYISPNCIFVWEISISWLYEALKGNCDQSYLNNALKKTVSCVTKMWHFWITYAISNRFTKTFFFLKGNGDCDLWMKFYNNIEKGSWVISIKVRFFDHMRLCQILHKKHLPCASCTRCTRNRYPSSDG